MKIRIKVYKGRKNNRTYIVILGALRLNRAEIASLANLLGLKGIAAHFYTKEQKRAVHECYEEPEYLGAIKVKRDASGCDVAERIANLLRSRGVVL